MTGRRSFERTCSLRFDWLLIAVFLVLAVPNARAQDQFIPLEDFERQFGNAFGPVDKSVSGFFALAKSFTATALLQGAGVFPPGVANTIPEFDTFADEARSALDGVPIPSGSVSVIYTFDPKLEVFTPSQQPMAPTISQSAVTNGRNRLTFGFSYSSLDYTHFNDFDHDNVYFLASRGVPFSAIVPSPGLESAQLVDVLYFNFKLRQQFYGFSAQYGILDNFDVGIFIPVVDVDFRGKAESGLFAQLSSDVPLSDAPTLPRGTLFELTADQQLRQFRSVRDIRQSDVNVNALGLRGIRFDEHRVGIGDIVLRSKYYAGDVGPAQLGVLLNVSLPTGDKDDLMGVGAVRFDPRLVASLPGRVLAGHVNAGFHADAEEDKRNRFDYSVGGEVRLASWATLLVDHVGRVGVSGQEIRKFEIVPGIKVNPYGDMVVGFNAIVPLNRDGLTTDWTPNATVEVSFVF